MACAGYAGQRDGDDMAQLVSAVAAEAHERETRLNPKGKNATPTSSLVQVVTERVFALFCTPPAPPLADKSGGGGGRARDAHNYNYNRKSRDKLKLNLKRQLRSRARGLEDGEMDAMAKAMEETREIGVVEELDDINMTPLNSISIPSLLRDTHSSLPELQI